MVDPRIRFWKSLYGAGAVGIILLFIIAVVLDGAAQGGAGMMTMLGILGLVDAAAMILAKVKLKGLQSHD